MEPTCARNWKFYVGVALLGYSSGTFGLAALVPLLFSPTVAATMATVVLISGELGFWVSAALLGKPAIDALKAKLAALFVRQWPGPPDSAGAEDRRTKPASTGSACRRALRLPIARETFASSCKAQY
jgi:hypothetical protein